MPNIIDSNGLQTKTQAELLADFTAAYRTIYGTDINIESSTPDGQLINIQIQAVLDVLDLLVQIYNSFDPDLAIGRTLDERCAINGIQRLGGTFTLTDVTLITDRALNLQGLDADINNPDGIGFTVSDNAGNQFILAHSQTVPAAGTYVFQFRSKVSGAVQTTPNTINVPVTIVLGVSSINNPTVLTTIGINEETDAELRLRRQKSVALSSQGYLSGLLAEILNINGVTSAFVYENNTGVTDADGIPSHAIWVIVNGGTDDEVARAIYSKRNAGCGMKGSVLVNITQKDGSPFIVKFDRTATEDLYIQFDASSMDGVNPIDDAYIKAQLVLRLSLGVNESVNINEVATIVQEIDSNCLVTNCLVGPAGDVTHAKISPSAKNLQFTLSAANISITDV